MENDDLGDLILRQTECSLIIQEVIVKGMECKDSHAARFLDQYYEFREPGGDWRAYNLFECRTFLTMLTFPICALARLKEEKLAGLGFQIEENYDLIYKEGDEQVQATVSPVLRTIRNALVHLPDFAADNSEPNISRPKDAHLRLCSRKNKSEVIFQSPEGFLNFANKITNTIREYAADIWGIPSSSRKE